ncbi:MAG: D-glucuronyl C5-epimerase family protein [Gaiellaceae bacterium]
MSATQSRRSSAGLFSSARTFFLPIGSLSDPDGVRGYPIDLRVKAASPRRSYGSGERLTLGVEVAQYGLACHERWRAGEGDEWLEAATVTGRHLVSLQEPDGSWLHQTPFRHTFPLRPPWKSAMAQGEAASLFVRLYGAVGDEQFADRALLALRPLYEDVVDGGVRARLDGSAWYEEYPTRPPSYVLNGAIFALWGLRDVAVGLGDAAAADAFQEGSEVLAQSLHRFDTGWWSLYSLYPHPTRNFASSFYHSLHVNQLVAMHRLDPRPEFAAVAARWAGYAARGASRRRAFRRKVLFRLLVPRNRLLAHRLPGRP